MSQGDSKPFDPRFPPGPLPVADIGEAVRTLRSTGDLNGALARLLKLPDGRPDGLWLGFLALNGSQSASYGLAPILGVDPTTIREALDRQLRNQIDGDFVLRGAEIVALALLEQPLRFVFAYPGTSELSLCGAIGRTPYISLVNGRGDKESVFLSVGGSLLTPNRACSILHAARGATNACGAIADARRNEIGTVVLCGLPSTRSSRFLPPHGEEGLLDSLSGFLKDSYEIVSGPSGEPRDAALATELVHSIRRAFAESSSVPFGPCLVGIPQDVSEDLWLPWSVVSKALGLPTATDRPSPTNIEAAANKIRDSSSTVIVIDDYLLKLPGALPALDQFATACEAPVLQVRYRRGPMLFERVHGTHVKNFLGWLDILSLQHRAILEAAELIITVEDRNMYPRVVGSWPDRNILAITSNKSKAHKNEYLGAGAVLVEHDPVATMCLLSQLIEGGRKARRPWQALTKPEAKMDPATSPPLRRELVRAIGRALERFPEPAIVDDSQTFGGLVATHYEELPPRTRIFGDHGGFVGSGLSIATGLAVCEPSRQVLCLLGDEGFGNGLQGLVPAGDQQAPVTVLLCNNGRSVSLTQQANASGEDWLVESPLLERAGNLRASEVAGALGFETDTIDFSLAEGNRTKLLARLEHSLIRALRSKRPSLIELRLPSDQEFWKGIWSERGLDEAPS